MNARRIRAIFDHLTSKTIAVVGDFNTPAAAPVLEQIIAYGTGGIRYIAPAPESGVNGYAQELQDAFASSDTVVVLDAGDGGMVNAAMRESLAELARRNRRVHTLARSERHIDKFRHITLCMTASEVMAMDAPLSLRGSGLARLVHFGIHMAERNKRPVFITLGSEGVLLCASGRAKKVPALPIDNDTALGTTAFATLAVALAGGAKYAEAAVITAVAMSLTGTSPVTPDKIAAQFEQYAVRFPDALS